MKKIGITLLCVFILSKLVDVITGDSGIAVMVFTFGLISSAPIVMFWNNRAKEAAKLTQGLFCPRCGYIGKPVKEPKGSLGVEVALWIFFLIPGLIYSVWRLSGQQYTCPKCKDRNMIPPDSPVAQNFLSESSAIKKTVA